MVNLVSQPSASPLAPILSQERADPRLALARILAEQNNASANVPLLNPMATLARALTMATPGLIQAKVAGDYQDRQKAASETMQQAASAMRTGTKAFTDPGELDPATGAVTGAGKVYGQDTAPGIDALAAVLSGNPDTAPMAANLQVQRALTNEDRQFRTSERKDSEAHAERLQTVGFGHAEQMQKQSLEFQATQGQLTRAQQLQLADLQMKHADALQKSQQGFTAGENALGRDQQTTLADKQLAAAEKRAQAAAELQTREHALTRETTLSAAKIRAGADDPTGGVPIGQNAELAAKLGVPLADSDPYKGLDRKTAQSLYKSNHQRVEKELDAGETEMLAARNRQQDAKRFMALNSETETGGVYGAPVVGGMAQGVAGMFSDNLKEMQSISDRLAPKMREPGSGSSSDLDVKKFENALFGPGKDRAVNENIAKAMIQKDQNVVDYQQFRRDYFDTNGHLGGAERAWRTYLNANPIFDPKAKEGTYTLNPGRVPYREFFGTKEAAPGQGAAPAAAPASSVPAPPAGFVVQ